GIMRRECHEAHVFIILQGTAQLRLESSPSLRLQFPRLVDQHIRHIASFTQTVQMSFYHVAAFPNSYQLWLTMIVVSETGELSVSPHPPGAPGAGFAPGDLVFSTLFLNS